MNQQSDSKNQISIITPVLNEAKIISSFIQYLFENGNSNLLEILIVDGGSNDETIELAKKAGAKVLKSPKKGRAAQMNFGAENAKGNILYFLHADTIPPKTYIDDILKAKEKENYKIGCYRLKINGDGNKLRFSSYFSRFNVLLCRGGDQSLFITKNLFDEIGGYDEKYCIMEEYDFIRKAYRKTKFKVIPKYILSSPRKYDGKSYFKINFIQLMVLIMFFLGFSPKRMKQVYQLAIK